MNITSTSAASGSVTASMKDFICSLTASLKGSLTNRREDSFASRMASRRVDAADNMTVSLCRGNINSPRTVREIHNTAVTSSSYACLMVFVYHQTSNGNTRLTHRFAGSTPLTSRSNPTPLTHNLFLLSS